jgi:hypothetical protein
MFPLVPAKELRIHFTGKVAEVFHLFLVELVRHGVVEDRRVRDREEGPERRRPAGREIGERLPVELEPRLELRGVRDRRRKREPVPVALLGDEGLDPALL